MCADTGQGRGGICSKVIGEYHEDSLTAKRASIDAEILCIGAPVEEPVGRVSDYGVE